MGTIKLFFVLEKEEIREGGEAERDIVKKMFGKLVKHPTSKKRKEVE